MILVGGAAKNIGKTLLVCSIITKYSKYFNLTGLKITSIYPDEKPYHDHQNILGEQDFVIFEEIKSTGAKDTIRMKNAGAHKVFFICAKDDFLSEAVNSFLNSIISP